MKKTAVVARDGYDPNRLLNAMLAQLKLRSDAALARALQVPAVMVNKVRRREIPVTPELLIRMEELSGWSARTLRDVMGDRRENFRFDDFRDERIEELLAEMVASAASKKGC